MTSNIVDKGGRIFQSSKLQLILWGEEWTNNTTHDPRAIDVIKAFEDLCIGPYFTHLSQYRKIRSPKFLTPVYNATTTPLPTTPLTKTQIVQCIKDSITSLEAADYRVDSNVIYAVIPSKGHDLADGVHFHSRFDWNGAIGYYAVITGNAATGGPGGTLGSHTTRLLRKLIGLLTSPDNGFDTPGFVYNTHTVVALPGFDEITDTTTTTGVTAGGYQAAAYESNDDNGLIVPDASPTVLPQADVGADSFGIKKLYADDTSKTAENWVMANLAADSRIRVDGSITNLGGGVFEGHVTSSDNPASFRINVNTTNPQAMDTAAQSVLGTHWDQMAVKGYMLDQRDWKNVEMTIYWKAVSWSDDDEMSLYCRGGRHGSGWPDGCIGTCYKGQIQRAGNSRWAKEYHHNSGSTGYVFTAGHNTSNLSARNNIWTGQKVVVFDKTVNGKKVVRMEVWKDEAGDSNPALQNWVMINYMEDAGSWGEPSDKGYISNCHAISQQMFSWGGPTATFRIDNVVVQVKKASVRNILPEGSTPTPGPEPCPTGQHFDATLGRCVNDEIPPPPPPGSDDAVPYIKFYNSGGVSNSNVFQSIGGAISSVELVSDTFNNLWDTLNVVDQRAGKKSTRVIYVKNTDPTLGLPDTKAYFGTVDTYTKMSLGAVPKNTTEPGVVTEVDEIVAYTPLISNSLSFSEVQKLDNTITKVADHFTGTTTPVFGKAITRYTIFARKVGAPTGTLTCKLLSSADAVKMTFDATFNVATAIPTASTDFTTLLFTKLGNNTIKVASGDRLSVEYPSGTSSNYIEIGIKKQVQSPDISLDRWNGTIWSPIIGDATPFLDNPPLPDDISANATARITAPGFFVDKGGRVMSAARVVIIYWGTRANKGFFDQAFKDMIEAPYFSKFRQYASIEPPTLFGTFVNTTTPQPNGWTDVNLVKCITDTIAAHPEIKPTTVNPFFYMVIGGDSRPYTIPSYGGFHTYANSTYGRLTFGVAVDFGGSGWPDDYIIASSSHEIYEGIVDPEYPTGIVAPAPGFLSGWTEIGDICAGQGDPDPSHPVGHPRYQGVHADFIGTALCAEYYSNIDGTCVVPLVEYNPGSPGAPPPTVTSAIAGKIETGGAPVLTPGKVFYNGGSFSVDSKIHLIFWGSQWPTQSNPSQDECISAVKNIISGTYLTGLSQYGGIHKPTFSGFTNDTTNFVNQSTHDNIVSKILQLIAAKKIPDFLDDPTIVYAIIAPKNINSLLNGAAAAYHTSSAITLDTAPDVIIPFSFMVNTAPTLDQFTIFMAHELAEFCSNDIKGYWTQPGTSDSNPPKDAWVVNAHTEIPLPFFDEICDYCDEPQEIPLNVGGVLCDRYYSNDDAGCIAPTNDLTKTAIFTTVLETSSSVIGQAVKMNNSLTKMAEHVWGVNAPIYNQRLVKIELFARKVGTPTGNLKCSIVNMPLESTAINELLAEGKYNEVRVFPLFNVTTLTTVFSKVSLVYSASEDYEPACGDAVMFEYTTGTSSNYIEIALGGNTFDIESYNGGMNLEFLQTDGTWDDYKPDSINGVDLAFTAYINSGFCFGSGQPGTGGAVGVVYKQPQNYESGLPIGQLNPGEYKSIIFQREIPPSSPTDDDAAIDLIIAAGGTNTPDPGGGPGNPPPVTCPTGQHVDPVTNLCVPNPPPVGGCTTTIYPGTGQTMVAKDSGTTTRHFASDGSSPTTEMEVNSCPFENYEMTAYMNIPSDESTFKMWGPNHTDSTCCWYLTVVSSNGDTHFGWEDPHPTTNKDCQSGPNIGNVGSKVIGIKGVIWKMATGGGAHVELWTDTDGVWKKQLSADRPCGKSYTKASSQQVLFRIDARPVIFQCAVVSEIKPNPSPISATAFVYPDAQDTSNLSPSSVAGTNALQSESNEEDNDVS